MWHVIIRMLLYISSTESHFILLPVVSNAFRIHRDECYNVTPRRSSSSIPPSNWPFEFVQFNKATASPMCISCIVVSIVSWCGGCIVYYIIASIQHTPLAPLFPFCFAEFVVVHSQCLLSGHSIIIMTVCVCALLFGLGCIRHWSDQRECSQEGLLLFVRNEGNEKKTQRWTRRKWKHLKNYDKMHPTANAFISCLPSAILHSLFACIMHL